MFLLIYSAAGPHLRYYAEGMHTINLKFHLNSANDGTFVKLTTFYALIIIGKNISFFLLFNAPLVSLVTCSDTI